ncbi:helix-turn-helix transcriptional regulator [Streptomyces sp. CRN 30]|uniref:helix-turn-helix transcriptional regulator n=1 Tax=Streptomyces sp. CRN 30 TaxID=3075613 RepID=UPI002A815A8F|nr:helix-turn-helix transcriptional regulator [Streptomyces sp. CRN 30]
MDHSSDNRMGDFLRTQRARLTPERVGLPATGPRRVRGLRREEVAVLAGVSADYYARMEQGRERTPSAQVTEAISAALHLGPEGREHLFRLARLSPSTLRADSEVSVELRQTIDAFAHSAALVTNAASRVLAANATASALFAPMSAHPTMTDALFLDDDARRFHVDWDNAARAEVCTLRLAMSYSPPHPEVLAVVDRLLEASAPFRALWNDEGITGAPTTSRVIEHPAVGLLRLAHQRFDVRGATGLELLVLSATPGSQSAEALARLSGQSGYGRSIDVTFADLTRRLEAGAPRVLSHGGTADDA